MDFFAEKSDLARELNFVRNAVEKRSTIPVLSHFLLEAEGFELRITATDLEITARSGSTPGHSRCRAGKTEGAAVRRRGAGAAGLVRTRPAPQAPR
jgi:DNA polymerase III beta subunit, N-terminal domain